VHVRPRPNLSSVNERDSEQLIYQYDEGLCGGGSGEIKIAVVIFCLGCLCYCEW
jgi:hypothetical protein